MQGSCLRLLMHWAAEGENKPEPKDLWLEPYAHKRYWNRSANGEINQQRVAVRNAVAIARLLNATLILPEFMYSSVWRDASQFGDIYQEDHFINYLKPDVPIVKDLLKDLQFLDLEAIGSFVMDTDIVKEAKPSFYLKYILPILLLTESFISSDLGTDWHLTHCHIHYRFPSPTELKSEGLCPLMPEETVLMLAALGFNRRTYIYLADAHIYGGSSRLAALTNLFPNLLTIENLLSQPFVNYSSQLAALDFIVCSDADAFAMTDSGSQFSSLVAGYLVYYGGDKMPTIWPSKLRFANIFVKNNTIEWKVFETRVRKEVRQNIRVFSRPVGRSVYRYPRCRDCMCHADCVLLLFVQYLLMKLFGFVAL